MQRREIKAFAERLAELERLDAVAQQRRIEAPDFDVTGADWNDGDLLWHGVDLLKQGEISAGTGRRIYLREVGAYYPWVERVWAHLQARADAGTLPFLMFAEDIAAALVALQEGRLSLTDMPLPPAGISRPTQGTTRERFLVSDFGEAAALATLLLRALWVWQNTRPTWAAISDLPAFLRQELADRAAGRYGVLDNDSAAADGGRIP